MVQEMLPYVRYVLVRHIPYIPAHLQEEACSVAYEALCRSAILYDRTRASFKTYAVQSMRKSVLKFLIREARYTKLSSSGTDEINRYTDDDYYSNIPLENVLDREMLKEIYQSHLIDEEMQIAFLLLADGISLCEIADYLRIPLSSLKNRIIKARQRIVHSGKWDCTSRKQKAQALDL